MENKVNVDLSEALDNLAQKLGVAADAIIPEYTKNIQLNGMLWIFAGLLLIGLPWLVFAVDIPIPTQHEYDVIKTKEGYKALYLILRGAFCILTTWIGAWLVFSHIENLVTPKAMAISRLLSQIK